MASDSQDTHRKHRRSRSSSEDDDTPEDSKRHKHRHHRHHHRRHRHHHRRHGSKKRDEEREIDADEVVEEVREIVVPSGGAGVVDYDMEEGEIVDDDDDDKGVIVENNDNGNNGEIAVDKKKIVDSDVESGEFKGFEDDSYTRTDVVMESPGTDRSLPPADNSRKSSKSLKSTGSDRSDVSKKHGSHRHHDESSKLERTVNGDSTNKSSKNESRSRARRDSPSKRSSKEKVSRESDSRQQSPELMEVDEDESVDQRKSSSRKVRGNHLKASSRSPSHGRYHLEASDRSRSASPDRMKDRARSQSISYDEHSRMRNRRERDDRRYDNGNVHDELDEGRDVRRSVDYRLDSRDRRRERSSSYHRSSMRGSKDEGGESWDRDREDKKRLKEQEIGRERTERDNDRDRYLEKRRDRSRGREREKEKESDKEKAREIRGDMDWDRERHRERQRDKDRGRSRDRDLDRERRRDNSLATYRDRDAKSERDTELRERDRLLDMDRGRDRNSARDRYRDKTRDVESERSRRYYKYDDRDEGYGNRDRRHGYEEAEYRRDRDRRHVSERDQGSKDNYLKENANGVNRDDDDQKDYQEIVDSELAEQQEDDPDRIKEESRRLREAILQKHKAKKLQHEAMPQSTKVSNEVSGDQPPQSLVTRNAIQENVGVKTNGQDSSATESSIDLGEPSSRNETMVVERSADAGALGEGSPKSERSNDMFTDDIFGDSPAGVRKTGKGDGLPVERSGLYDNWDDPEGYYSFRFGEILDSRYEITAAHGKGVFSTVVRAKDLKAGAGDPEEVAIKIIRNNETMLKAGTEELVILKKLVGADPDDRRHCVRYLSHFKYRNHLCIVFESLHMNLREVLKKFGRNIGLKLTAVRAYAKQLFIALKHLKNCGVLHCDIKPDNMLVNDAKNVLKLCDFGNAMFAGKNEITPYLVSRFYRSPEIILGLPYDHPMDIWSVGCCLYELYTGKVLFPGSTNNDMLRLHMELKGPFPKKMLRKGAFIEQHFDQDLNFLALEEDPVTKKTVRRSMVNIKPKDIGTIIKGSPGEDPKMLANFKELLDKIFALDPDKRLTVSQALSHPFITGK